MTQEGPKAETKQIGRPTKLTEEVTKVICEAIELGSTYKLAAAAAGVSDRAMTNWLARGRQGGPGNALFVRFVRAVKDAEARGVKTCLEVIRKAAREGTWTAAAWLLERRYPAQYGRVSRMPVEHKRDDEGEQRSKPIEVINSIREIYGLPPKKDTDDAEKASGGSNGSSAFAGAVAQGD